MIHHPTLNARLASGIVAATILGACTAQAGFERGSSTSPSSAASPTWAARATAPHSVVQSEPGSPVATPEEPPALSHIAFGIHPPNINLANVSKLEGVEALTGLLPAGGKPLDPLVEGARFEWRGPLNSGNPRATQAHLMTFAFRYPDDAAAQDAHRSIVGALENAPEWAPHELVSGGLGEEPAGFRRADDDGRQDVAIVWRRADLVLAIIGHNGTDPAVVYDIARRMDERAG